MPCYLARRSRKAPPLVCVITFISLLILFLDFLSRPYNLLRYQDPLSKIRKYLHPDLRVYDRWNTSSNVHTTDTIGNIINRLKQDGHDVNISQDVSTYPYEVNKCPVCYGVSLCALVQRGQIVLEKHPYNNVFFGNVGSFKLVGKRLSDNERFDALDDFICSSEGRAFNKCAVSETVENSFISVKFSKLLGTGMFWKTLTGEKLHRKPFTMCASLRLVDEMWKVYSKIHSGEPEMANRLQFMTSLVIHPEGLLLQFFSSFPDSPWPFPRYIGECGRLVIVEHAGTPLREFYDAPWVDRARLVLDVFDVVDRLQRLSPDWSILFTDLHSDNFAVSPSGELVIVDLEDILVLDKHLKQNAGRTRKTRKSFKELKELADLVADDPDEYCQDIPHSDVMYLSVCILLLSNWENATRVGEDAIGIDGNIDTSAVRIGALLDDPPPSIRDELETLLARCLHENSSGDRLHAIEQLRRILRQVWNGFED